MIDRHILSVTVRDRPGVLVRIAGLFARRGFNIESLSVAQSFQPGISRTTFVVSGEEETIEQVEKQLQKLIDVIKVVDHTKSKYVDRSRSTPPRTVSRSARSPRTSEPASSM